MTVDGTELVIGSTGPFALDPGGWQRREAFVVPKSTVTPVALTARLQEKVRTDYGKHGYPRVIHYVCELPKTESGKIKRNVLARPSAEQIRGMEMT